MQYKKYTKQRIGSIQGLRSFKDTLPEKIKKVINKRGQVYSEILNNWKYIVGKKFFDFCYPKSYKNSNKFSVSTLLVMVQRGHEIEVEYSKNEIIDRMNNFFKEEVVERLKFTSFEEENNIEKRKILQNTNVTNNKYISKIKDVKNDKIKKSLIELTKVFKEK